MENYSSYSSSFDRSTGRFPASSRGLTSASQLTKGEKSQTFDMSQSCSMRMMKRHLAEGEGVNTPLVNIGRARSRARGEVGEDSNEFQLVSDHAMARHTWHAET